MNDPLQALIEASASNSRYFPATSRYHVLATKVLRKADGTTVIYLERRFVPPPENFELLQEHTVTEGERLDNITAHYFSDPELFWKLCDGNRAMQPDELTRRIGRRLRITLPEGVPGVPGA